MQMRLSLRKLLATATFSVALCSAVSAQASEKLALTHTVYLGGLYVGSVKTDIVQTDISYSIESKAETNSTWRWLFTWAAEGRSQGLISHKKLSPELHIHQSAWNNKKRGALIEYSPAGKVSFKNVGKTNSNLKKYTPLDPESVHQSMDPMSVILAAAVKLQNEEECSGTYPVFDGRRRYDILLETAPKRMLRPSEYSVFSGPAKGCKIAIDKKGGFVRGKTYELPPGSELILWAGAPVDGGRIVPVRMEVETEFGVMEMHLAGYFEGKTKLASKNAQ